MILTRAPLRIPLGGGGTDLPSYGVRREAARSSSPSLKVPQRAIFLDRDGTINAMVRHGDHDVPGSPTCPDEFNLLRGVGEAVWRINAAGILAVLVSNQPGIAQGKFTIEALDAMTRKMHQELAGFGAKVDAVFYCIHHPEALLTRYRVRCDCRKPSPGLLLRGAAALGIELRRSYMVGDSVKDIQAGAAAGCRTVWLGHQTFPLWATMERDEVRPDHVAGGLPEAVEIILRDSEDRWARVGRNRRTMPWR